MITNSCVRGHRGSVFISILVILFVVTLIGMSGLLYWEKAQLEKEKSVQAALALQEKYTELEKRYSKLETEYQGALTIKQFIADKFVEYGTKTQESVDKLESLSSRLDQQLGELATAAGGKNKKKGSVTQTKAIELPPVIVKDDKKEAEESVATKEKTEETEKTAVTSEKTVEIQEAQVMSVNKERGFVVINKGLVDGVKIGDIFKTTQGEQPGTQLKISEIRDFVSLGTMVDSEKGFFIKEGDKVRKDS